MTQLNVGITIGDAPADTQAVLWANGLSQNIVYLALLLRRIPSVRHIFLVTNRKPHPVGDTYGFQTISVDEAAATCDVVVELGARNMTTAHIDHLRKRGGKIVSFMAGNTMAFNFEAIAHGAPNGEIVPPHRFDASWVLPQHWHMCRSYAQMVGSDNVEQVPVLWDPIFLNQSAALYRKNVFWREPEGGKYAVGCFDPNVNVLKTFHIPLLATEVAWRLDSAKIDKLLLFSTLKFKGSRHLTEMIMALDIGKAGRVTLEDRHPLVHVMGSNVHAVMTHQWENNRNYLYYEILYLGWPLIHNAPSLKDAGYYYGEFDCEEGGRQLHEALSSHAETRVKQRDAIREALWEVSIENPANQDRYAQLLHKVMG